MTGEDGMTENPADRSTQDEAGVGATHEEMLAAHLPPQEAHQPDPVLQPSVGRLGAGSITLVAIVAAIILAVVFYGLNSPAPNTQTAGAAPSALSTPAAAGNGSATTPGTQHGSSGHS